MKFLDYSSEGGGGGGGGGLSGVEVEARLADRWNTIQKRGEDGRETDSKVAAAAI